MVLLPLGALGALGAKLVADQRLVAEREVDQTMNRMLETIADAVGTVIRSFDRELGRMALTLPTRAESEVIRKGLQTLPRAMMVVITDAQGIILHPPDVNRSLPETRFLERIQHLWVEGVPPFVNAKDSRNRGLERGWIPFRSEGTFHFLRWQKIMDTYVAFEVNGDELTGELISQLPGSPIRNMNRDVRVASQTILKSPDHDVVYLWGRRTLPEEAEFRKEIRLSQDLGGWTLQHFSEDNPLPDMLTETLRHTIYAGLSGLAVALGAGAWLIWLARTREIRMASRRVSFVNQVSHELKTPLTNIRMYAELLAQLREGTEDYDEAGREGRYLKTIARESERLSRMIKNVLSFSRGQEDKLELRLQRCIIDELVMSTLSVHEPTLMQAGVKIERSLDACSPVMVDADAVEQILTNLISNIEKYGKQGAWMKVTTRLAEGVARIVVEDRGPGIPEALREKIFEPFWRMSDKASDGVSGTGLGLDIARRLARLHGGDLKLLSGRNGATFEIELKVGRVEDT